MTDPRLAMRAYHLAYAEWVVCRGKQGPPPEMPPHLRSLAP